jgi:hypothetical protein
MATDAWPRPTAGMRNALLPQAMENQLMSPEAPGRLREPMV